ncbi:hypothetical protein G5714_004122 [Onychostoma macrolepis]|uniref:Uncharacterized protein n=1 Tax=Onychostoma macrolepis TaxID=369639 RepID=A0A7J6DBF0_9TELE|nr:hypothetical protein G5714_004122 [Onychostoma macrolepis]
MHEAIASESSPSPACFTSEQPEEWLHFVRPARDPLNRQISTRTALPQRGSWLVWGEAAGEALPSPHSPVTFPEDGFHSPPNIAEFVLFGQEEEDKDSIPISALEKEDWVVTEHDCPVSEGPPDLQEELVRVMTTAIQEHELTWSPLEKPAKSKLDSWKPSPVSCNGQDPELGHQPPLKAMQGHRHLSNKACASDGEAASVLHDAQVSQVKLLLIAAEGDQGPSPGAGCAEESMGDLGRGATASEEARSVTPARCQLPSRRPDSPEIDTSYWTETVHRIL